MSPVLHVVLDLSCFYLRPHHNHHPPLKEIKPECYCSVSLTDKLCAALIHSLHFLMWSLFYHWVGTEKEEQVDRAGAAVLGNLPLMDTGFDQTAS